MTAVPNPVKVLKALTEDSVTAPFAGPAITARADVDALRWVHVAVSVYAGTGSPEEISPRFEAAVRAACGSGHTRVIVLAPPEHPELRVAIVQGGTVVVAVRGTANLQDVLVDLNVRNILSVRACAMCAQRAGVCDGSGARRMARAGVCTTASLRRPACCARRSWRHSRLRAPTWWTSAEWCSRGTLLAPDASRSSGPHSPPGGLACRRPLRVSRSTCSRSRRQRLRMRRGRCAPRGPAGGRQRELMASGVDARRLRTT